VGCRDRPNPLLHLGAYARLPPESEQLNRRTRVLIAYYSRTDTTRTVAHYLAQELGAHIESLVESTARASPRPSWRCAADALLGRRVALSATRYDASAHDLVVVGSPVWYASVSSPVRSYLAAHAGKLENVAFFVTCGGWRPERALQQMIDVSRCAPLATMTLRDRDLRDGYAALRAQAFAAALAGPAARGKPGACGANSPVTGRRARTCDRLIHVAGRDEGIIKFECVWQPGPAPQLSEIASLDSWRCRCFAMGLVGVTPEGVGYGNLSARIGDTAAFWVTGSGTGAYPKLGPENYTRVIKALPERNRVLCEGPVRASSESMTHAVLYEALPDVRAVIHVHSASLWRACLYRLPTTAGDIAYGTPAMCRAVAELAPGAKRGVIVMGGHEDGIVAFGETVDQAGNRLLEIARDMIPGQFES